MPKAELPFALWTPCAELGDTPDTPPLSTLAGWCRTPEGRREVALAIASAVDYLGRARTCRRNACRRSGCCRANAWAASPEHMCRAGVPGALLLVMAGACLAYGRERDRIPR